LASEVIYLHKYFQIFNYFISQDSKNVGLSCRNTTPGSHGTFARCRGVQKRGEALLLGLPLPCLCHHCVQGRNGGGPIPNPMQAPNSPFAGKQGQGAVDPSCLHVVRPSLPSLHVALALCSPPPFAHPPISMEMRQKAHCIHPSHSCMGQAWFLQTPVPAHLHMADSEHMEKGGGATQVKGKPGSCSSKGEGEEAHQ